ncbi:hypothetical protein ACOSQ2_017370 [Xanthoceras sorbifolium]
MMDQFDATSVLFDKVKSMDSENASKIMGYILIQDFKEGDLVSLAFGPETLLQSLVFKARIHLGLSSNTMSTAIPPTNHPTFARVSPRVANNGFVDFEQNMSLSDPKASPFLSYDNIRSGSCLVPGVSHLNNGGGCGGVVAGDIGSNSRNTCGGDLVDEHQFNDYLSFLNENSKNEEFNCEVRNWGQDVSNGDTHLHRRSFSASDVCFGTDDASFGAGYAPCHYFARGFCKNGDNCKFVHGDFGDNVDGNGVLVGSPSKMNGLYLQLEEMMRLKAQQQQRLAASQFAAAGVSSLPYDKRMNFLLQQQNDAQRVARAAMMLGDDFHKFGCGRPERNDFFAIGLAEKVNSASRQIYLTFPADSTFKDEDVSNYFNIFGPVQDVRIPYQQRRMFGFVTFLHPETVKLVLTRGNPHFICDSRVLVKPYKEKGKAADRRQQQFERGNFSPCSSPSGVDSVDSYDLNLGTTNFYNTREMMLRRKLEEQAKLQQAIEFQSRRFMNLQLPDLKNHIHHHQRSLSVGAPLTLHSHDVNQNAILPGDGMNQEVLEGESPVVKVPSTTNAATEQHPRQEVNGACIQQNDSGSSREDTNYERSDLHEHGHESNVDNVLPDTLFASPTKKSAESRTPNSSILAEANASTAVADSSLSSESSPEMPTTSTTDMASHD